MIVVINGIIVAVLVLMSVVVGLAPEFRGLVEKDARMTLFSNAHLRAVRDGQLAVRAGDLTIPAGQNISNVRTSFVPLDNVQSGSGSETAVGIHSKIVYCKCALTQAAISTRMGQFFSVCSSGTYTQKVACRREKAIASLLRARFPAAQGNNDMCYSVCLGNSDKSAVIAAENRIGPPLP
jgi:hypothetical protein